MFFHLRTNTNCRAVYFNASTFEADKCWIKPWCHPLLCLMEFQFKISVTWFIRRASFAFVMKITLNFSITGFCGRFPSAEIRTNWNRIRMKHLMSQYPRNYILLFGMPFYPVVDHSQLHYFFHRFHLHTHISLSWARVECRGFEPFIAHHICVICCFFSKHFQIIKWISVWLKRYAHKVDELHL